MNGSPQYYEVLGSGESGDSQKKRIAMFLAGSSAMALGFTRKGWARGLMAAGGGALIYQSLISEQPVQTYFVVSKTINRPVEEVYAFFRDKKNWPVLDKANAQQDSENAEPETAGQILELCDEVENRTLRWQLSGRDGEGEIGAQFAAAPGNRGTEVWIFSECTMPTSPVRRAFKLAAGSSAEQAAREHLRQCKQLLECGEIPTTQGQSAGRRGLIGKAKRVMLHENPIEVPMQRRPVSATERVSKEKFAAS